MEREHRAAWAELLARQERELLGVEEAPEARRFEEQLGEAYAEGMKHQPPGWEDSPELSAEIEQLGGLSPHGRASLEAHQREARWQREGGRSPEVDRGRGGVRALMLHKCVTLTMQLGEPVLVFWRVGDLYEALQASRAIGPAADQSGVGRRRGDRPAPPSPRRSGELALRPDRGPTIRAGAGRPRQVDGDRGPNRARIHPTPTPPEIPIVDPGRSCGP